MQFSTRRREIDLEIQQKEKGTASRKYQSVAKRFKSADPSSGPAKMSNFKYGKCGKFHDGRCRYFVYCRCGGRVILAEIASGVCEFASIATRKATLELVALFSSLVRCKTP